MDTAGERGVATSGTTGSSEGAGAAGKLLEGDAGAAGQSEPDPLCTPVHTHLPIPQRAEVLKEVPLDTFANLVGQIEIQCGNCHKAPAKQGNFSFLGTAKNLCEVRGKGPKALEQTVADVMLSGYMPFMIGGQQALGLRVKAWLQQGCPEGTYVLPNSDGSEPDDDDGYQTEKSVGNALTDLGNCLPKAALAGADAKLDALFERLDRFSDLPAQLSETDFVSLDSAVLAKRGTYAYSPTYPLWSDDARKLRHLHVPSGQAVTLNPETKQFDIPNNTRFYKTFLREVKDEQGQSHWRKMETRLIVVRGANPIYGTYVWNSDETEARLLGSGLDPASPDKKEVYLSGQPFPDYVFTYNSDAAVPDERRDYPVPGGQRCVSCHQGSLNGSFILGLTPTQMKHRAAGEGGVYEDVLPDELDQLMRLQSYGVFKDVEEANIPKLEDSALPRQPATSDELNIQAYMVGNCAHCHNPNGYAVSSSTALAALDMSPGGSIFQFDLSGQHKSVGDPEDAYGGSGRISASFPANPPPNPLVVQGSVLLRRTLVPTQLYLPSEWGGPATTDKDYEAQQFGRMNLHMPLHTSGIDCRLPKLMVRWITNRPASPSPEDAARAREITSIQEAMIDKMCRETSAPGWVLEDTTERFPYVERNIDWRSSNDPTQLPPDWLKALEVTQAHEDLAKKPYTLGYFEAGCEFPDAPVPADAKPWMYNSQTGEPSKRFSQVYRLNPGELVFSAICANCHGYRGDAQTGAARVIRYTSGARVASFADGLFGPAWERGGNLSAFDQLTSNGPVDKPAAALGAGGADKYVVWMANGGTHVSFGRTAVEERAFFSAFVGERSIKQSPIPLTRDELINGGKNAKANMLQLATEICDKLRKPEPSNPSDPIRLWNAAKGEPFPGAKWDALFSDNPPHPAFGVEVWQDICTLENPITDAIRQETDPSTPALQAWLNRAVFNAGTMAYLYMRDELTQGIYAPNLLQCSFRYPVIGASSP